MRVGLDLDGCIIDHHQNKIRLAAERGFELLPWQTNTNVFGQFLPHPLLEELQEQMYTVETSAAPAVSGALEAIKNISCEAYIISARTSRSFSYALEWMGRHNIFKYIPQDRIIFCESSGEKRGHCDRLGVSVYLDDKISVLENLSDNTRKVLFDEDLISPKILAAQNIQTVKSWKEFLSILPANGQKI